MARFLGFVPLGLSITGSVCTKDTNGQPANPVAPPTYRIYGPTGVMLNGTGSMFAEDSGTISGATNASPIVITDTDHNLSTGTLVTLSGIGGNTAANGTFNITVIDANTYSLNGSAGNGGYSGGGVRNVTGLYSVLIAAVAGNGYTQNQSYTVYVNAKVGSNQWADLLTFVVV